MISKLNRHHVRKLEFECAKSKLILATHNQNAGAASGGTKAVAMATPTEKYLGTHVALARMRDPGRYFGGSQALG